MGKAVLVVWVCGVGMAGVGTAWAQQQPTAYTVTQTNSMMTPAITQTIYRNGSKAAIDTDIPAANGSPASHSRSLYDLPAGKDESWNLTDPNVGCSSGTFSGDWGDPFKGLVDVSTGTVTGTDTVSGFATNVYSVNVDGTIAKVWVEAKTGLPMKVQATQGGTTTTYVEVTKFAVGAPPASVFVLPVACTAAAGPPPPTQREKDIAAETNSQVGDFVDAVMTSDAGSVTACSVNIRVMVENSMKPIPSGFTLSAKVLDDQGNDGAALTVTAGANGVWRLNNPSVRFDMSEDFGNGGGGGGTVRRWCVSPTSTLLLVVKDPTKLGLGADWLWDVKGKYAVK